MSSRRTLPALALFALAVAALVLVASRPWPPAGAAAAHPAVRAAPLTAPVLLEAFAVQIPAWNAENAEVRAALDALPPGGSGVLNGPGVPNLLADLGARGLVQILSRPRVMVMSGEPARITVTLAGAAAADERHSLEVFVRPTAYDDGSVTLTTEVSHTDLQGKLELLIDDMGVPIGTRGAEAELRLKAGSVGVLAARVRGGDRLVVLLTASVPPPPANSGK